MTRALLPALALALVFTSALPAGPATAPADPAAAGRVLLSNLNCVACHPATETQAAWVSPKMAPRLNDLGNRADPRWVQKYLADPQGTFPGVSMPDPLNALPPAERGAAAEAITHFLFSQSAPKAKPVLPDRAAVARGEALYHRVGCVACHRPIKEDAAAMPAAPFPNLAEKWRFEGLRRFLMDPLASRPSGRMPLLKLTDNEAADIAHYLLRETKLPAIAELASYRGRVRSLEEIDEAELGRTGPIDAIAVDEQTRDRGSALRFTSRLRVDQAGQYTFYLNAAAPARLAIDDKWIAGEGSWDPGKVNAKVSLKLEAGWHAIKVDYVHRGQKPPMMKLEWEGPGVPRGPIAAAHLRLEKDEITPPPAFVVDKQKAEAGKALYAKFNCAACHDPKPAGPAAKSLATLDLSRGCLAANVPATSPKYQLEADGSAKLAAAIRSLNDPKRTAPTAADRVAHTFAALNCIACHRRDGVGGVTAARDRYFTSNGEDLGDEGRIPPSLDGVGNKLIPAWIDNMLTQGGAVRPYVDTRMPQFGKDNVGHLTELLVQIDRKPEKLAASSDDAATQKEAGRTLVGTNGLSCIVCHRFNRQPAQTMQLVDLTTATQRLNEDWFRAFLLDPNRFHPGTRMPTFWPGGKSAIPTVLGGDTTRQHAAIWTYLADGSQAKFPEGMSRQNVELIVGGEAVTYRGKLWEAGFRAVAIGYPGQVNVAYDAEELRLSLLWRGKFLNAGPHWQVQGMGQIRPMGTDVVVLPHGAELAVLKSETDTWPTEGGKAAGMKFRGYQLDEAKQPTLLYSYGSLAIEDLIKPSAKGKAGIERRWKFGESIPDGLHLRLAAGKLKPAGDKTWRLDDAITIRVLGDAPAHLRGEGNKQELIVPIRPQLKDRVLEVEYAW